MFFDINSVSETTRILLEVFGYIGSAVCVASFAMTSVKKLRIINGIGAVLSTIYALLIGALPLALMNIIIANLDAYQLYRMNHVHEVFEIVPATSDAAYFSWFIDRYKKEIEPFDSSFAFKQADKVFYYVRDNEVAGILAYNEKDHGVAEIKLDFVIPKYRDFRIGNYFFGPNNPFFKEVGIGEFVTRTTNPIHEAYLKRINFTKRQNGEWCKAFV